MEYLLKTCSSNESGQQNEKKTLRKLAYGRVFCEGMICGECRTTDEREAFGGCSPDGGEVYGPDGGVA